jgi:GrpB-like predicted nucleotidyltransferase (UPF0157 family)/GNAT superfamily N-acetyltransferase
MNAPPEIVIRPAQAADTPGLLDLIHAAFAAYAGQLDPPSGAHAETTASLQRLFAAGETAALAEADGAPVGCVFCVRHGVEMYAHRLAVLPGWRGHGIGQALMAYVEEQARAAGCRYVRVGVRLALPGNIAFFARQGYTAIIESSHPGYSAPTFVHMTRELDSLRLRAVVVTPYNAGWPAQFAAESAALGSLLGDLAVEIHHVGSTSVPGLAAKPIIDIMPIVRDIRAVDRHLSAMADLGYAPRGEYGLPGRRYFSKDTNRVRSHHVHMYELDNPEVTRHLAFRDYLRAHPAIARQYGDLKLGLAQAHPTDIDAYMDGKDGFIKTTEAQAVRWYRG